MPKIFGDEVGLFWKIDVRAKRNQAVKVARPPLPESDWSIPEFPNLKGSKVIGIDVETYDPDLKKLGPGVRRDGYVVGLSVAADDGTAWYFPMRHKEGTNIDPAKVKAWANDQLSTGTPKVGANILYDLDYLTHEGYRIGGLWFDVQNAEPLLDENLGSYSLEALAQRYFGEGKEETLLVQAAEAYGFPSSPSGIKSNLWAMDAKYVGPYAEQDAALVVRLLAEQIKRMSRPIKNLYKMETRLVPALLAMRQKGVAVDLDKVEHTKQRLDGIVQDLLAEWKYKTGYKLERTTPASQIAPALDAAGIAYPRTAKTKAPQFRKAWLENHEHELPRHIAQIRAVEKILNTFIDGHILGNVVNGRIHCEFHQLRNDAGGARTGRLSSSNPNMQNIPVRSREGKIIRSLFIPDSGKRWTKFDYSQIEYRLLVHHAIGEGASEAKRMYVEDPTTDFHNLCSDMVGGGIDRRIIKNINFGTVYGAGAGTIAAAMGQSIDTARDFLNTYHESLPFVKQTGRYYMQKASSNGYVETHFHRRRHFDLWEPMINNDHTNPALPREQAEEAYGERIKRAHTHKALNAVLQGGAADIIKKAIVDCFEAGLPIPMLTVHDELDFSEDDPTTLARIKECMEGTVQLEVPIYVDQDTGENWGSCG